MSTWSCNGKVSYLDPSNPKALHSIPGHPDERLIIWNPLEASFSFSEDYPTVDSISRRPAARA